MATSEHALVERAARRYQAARHHVERAEYGSPLDREAATLAALRELTGAVHDLLRAQGVDPTKHP